MHLRPQVKALLHEGPESPHRRSLIPPVTFEVSDCGPLLYSWGPGFWSLWKESFWLDCTRTRSPMANNGGEWDHLPVKMVKC